MSQSQPVSTEDLAGRPRPDESPAGGSAETSQTAQESTAQGTDPGQYDTASGTDGGQYDTASATAAPLTAPAPRTDDELPTAGQQDNAQTSRPDSRDQEGEEDVSLVDEAQAGQFRERWSSVQARFVDDPRAAVGSADALVAELMQSLAAGFADHKGRLETQWQGGGEADTEELRLALRRYRVFFQRLLQT